MRASLPAGISFQPCNAKCWKLFQSVPLLEVFKMTFFIFHVNGFFLTYVRFRNFTLIDWEKGHFHWNCLLYQLDPPDLNACIFAHWDIFSAMQCEVLKTIPKCSSPWALRDDLFHFSFYWILFDLRLVLQFHFDWLRKRPFSLKLLTARSTGLKCVHLCALGYLFSHAVLSAENCFKVVLFLSSMRWLFSILMSPIRDSILRT